MRSLPVAAIFWIICFCIPGDVLADSSVAIRYFSEPKLVGRAEFSYLFWDVYDAELYAQKGRWEEGKPMALVLYYRQKLSGKAIARRSREEIARQKGVNTDLLDNWEKQMAVIFPDVDEQTSLTGVYTDKGEAIFYRNGLKIGEIADREFSKRFFDIWVGEETSEPELRRELLNLKSGNNES